MLIIYHYKIRFDRERDLYVVKGKTPPLCPDCGVLLSGYDSRRRRVIERDGSVSIYLLRRLKCPSCDRLHLEIPDIIAPAKHYSADVIEQVRAGDSEDCPADDSTIRRWRKEK